MSDYSSWLAEQTLVSLEDDTRIGTSISSAKIFPGDRILYVELLGPGRFKYRVNHIEITRGEAVDLLAGAIR